MSVQLSPGDPAPPFTLPDSTGTPVSLADQLGSRVILYAHPEAGTPGCTTQACDFRDNLGSMTAAGYVLLGISPDPVSALAAFAETESLPFPLLSDADRSVLTAYGAYGEKQRYGKTVTGVIRSTFVIDAEGNIERAMYNVKATGHVAVLRRELAIA